MKGIGYINDRTFGVGPLDIALISNLEAEETLKVLWFKLRLKEPSQAVTGYPSPDHPHLLRSTKSSSFHPILNKKYIQDHSAYHWPTTGRFTDFSHVSPNHEGGIRWNRWNSCVSLMFPGHFRAAPNS